MNLAYSYLRFSTSEQSKGDSFRRQTHLADHYCQQHGLTLDTTLNLVDLGVSAFKGTNVVSGRLGAFLQAIETGRVVPGSVLLIESLDRLSRTEVPESLNLFTKILNRDITIITLTDQRVYTRESINDITNLLTSILIMARSHDESVVKSKRLFAAWQNKRIKARTGQVFTRNVPGWLRVEHSQIVPIKNRAALVRRMFQMSLNGMGIDLIAKTLNKERIAPWGRANGWRMNYVNKILRHRAVIGEFVPMKLVDGRNVPQEPIRNYYPHVIDDELFYAVQHALTARKSMGGEVGDRVNMFSHLVKCFHCGSSLVKINKGKNSKRGSFACDAGRRGVNGCGVVPWRIDDFEKKVLNAVTEVDLSRILGGEHTKRVASLHLQLTAHRAQLTDAQERLKRLVDALEQGANVAPVVERIRQIETEIETLTTECAVTEKQYQIEKHRMDTAENRHNDFLALMKVVGDREVRFKLREQLRSLIERIDVDLVKQQMVVWYIGQRPRMRPISPSSSGSNFDTAIDRLQKADDAPQYRPLTYCGVK